MRTSTTIRRLEKALEIMQQPLADLPVDEFDIGDWGYKQPCGTAACGIGTLSLHPAMRRIGLRSRWGGFGDLEPSFTHPMLSDLLYRHYGFVTMTARVFGISQPEAEQLADTQRTDLDHNYRFGKTGKITKAVFCNRLKNLIATYKAKDEMREAA